MYNLFKVKNKDNRKIARKIPHAFIVNFKQISHIVLLFPLLTLNKKADNRLNIDTKLKITKNTENFNNCGESNYTWFHSGFKIHAKY